MELDLMPASPHRLIATAIIRDGRQYHGAHGPLYLVTYNGGVLVASTTQPLLDGARVLKSQGLSGPVELWDDARPFPRMRSTVDAAAGLTVQEGRRQSPKLGKWTPFTGLADAPQEPEGATPSH